MLPREEIEKVLLDREVLTLFHNDEGRAVSVSHQLSLIVPQKQRPCPPGQRPCLGRAASVSHQLRVHV